MRIGITLKLQFSYFSGGGGHAALAIAEACIAQGHNVNLLNVHGSNKWWEDVKDLEKTWAQRVIQLADMESSTEPPFDLVLELEPSLLTPNLRQKVTKRAVWVIRKPVLLHDVEASLFPFEQKGRELEGIQEVWCMNHAVTRDDVQYLEVLTRRPVRIVPWLWTPSAVETQRRSAQQPVWPQVAAMEQYKQAPWSIHITETNYTSASSSVIPLVILRELKQRKACPALNSSVKIHNIEHLKGNAYFNGNVVSHCIADGLINEYLGRQRVMDWVLDPKSLIVAHSRFMKIRPYLLDAIWCGIPVLHNSLLLKGLGHGCERMFYAENDINHACESMIALDADWKEQKGFFAAGALDAIRREILMKFSPFSPVLLEGWKSELARILTVAPFDWSTAPVATPAVPGLVTAPAPISASASAPPTSAVATTVASSASAPTSESVEKKVLKVGFCDMWENFNPEYNPFLLMLNDIGVEAVRTTELEGADVVIFGPFGITWESVSKKIPKIHYTGENSGPVEREDVVLNLGFQYRPDDKSYIRLPLWMLEINWWNADVEKLQNPKPLPLDAVTRKWSDTMSQREKFCAFIVSNPSNETRNRAFCWLNDKKKVDSAGRLYNNIGPELFAGLGGGGGELKKHEFLKSYKYCFAYENSSAPGYTTEKLLHAKAAGCIPLYWGDSEVEKDFDIRGFLDMRSVTTKEEFYAKIQSVEESTDAWRAVLDIPALSEQKVVETRAHLRMVAERIVAAAVTLTMPEATAVTASSLRLETNKNTIVFSTGFNVKFLNSFNLWANSIEALERGNPSLSIRGVVYAMNDIPDSICSNIQNRHKWITIRRFPKESLPDFEDWLAPEHYAWKLYIHQELVKEKELAGATVFYVDSGAFVCRLPTEAMKLANEKGVCVIDDNTQKNLYWCHQTFCEKLQVTEDEKNQNQILAGLLVYKAGHPVAISLFDTAWSNGKQRDIIVGKKWEGYHHDGHPIGHRHDQSILSILTQRNSIPRVPLDTMYCHTTLRDSYNKGVAYYVHRGNFVTHIPFARGISEAHIINMERRKDRMEKFNVNHPDLKDSVVRFNAYDGRKLRLTPALARLFRPNDFKWKKAIMGCALSHLELWLKLISDTKDIESYLILEDDVKFNERWGEIWEQASSHVPEDWDVIYLGGVLPPNRDGFELVKEKVNEWFSRVALNQVFGQHEPSRYFHFCNYSYILSKKGAKKIIDILKARDGYWTSADHMICNNVNEMNLYFLDPLVAGCYQDEDPAYKNSAFNNYSRVDSFDSDLWNNTDYFTEEEVQAALAENGSEGIRFGTALGDARRTIQENTQAAAVAAGRSPDKSRVIYTFKKETASANYFEYKWLKSIFPETIDPQISYIDPETLSASSNEKEYPIILYQSQDLSITIPALIQLSNRGVSFILLHLSDEHGADSLDVYSLPGCKHVIRNYSRPELVNYKNVTVIPLGPHAWKKDTKEENKKFIWSFHGTGWAKRPQQLAPFRRIAPFSLQFYDSWMDAQQLKEEEYCKILSQSVFAPCPGGNNIECFRFYEALECGAIPLVVQQSPSESAFIQYITSKLPIKVQSSWVETLEFITNMVKTPESLYNYHKSLVEGWECWKKELATTMKTIL